MDDKLNKVDAKKLEEERMLHEFRRVLLSTEETLDECTMNRIRDKWFKALLNIRVPEMQDNLKHILHYMEKLIETHGFRKLLFEEERQTLDKMCVKQAQSQSSAIATLNDIYVKRVEDMQMAYKQKVMEKKKEADEEFAILESREITTRENMQTMLFQMEQNRNKKEDQMNCDMFFKIDDEKSKNMEKLENLRSTLEKKMEKRWEEINTTLSNYDLKTQQRRQHYAVLKAKDDYDSKIIYQQMKKTQKLFEQLEDLKKCYETSYAPENMLTLIANLREEKNKFFDSFKYLKKVLSEEVKEDQGQLKFLTGLTDNITEELKEICERGEKILTVFRICRKFETEEEKVIPVGGVLHLLKPTEALDKRKHVQEDRSAPETQRNLTETLAKDFEILNKFWKKSSKVRLSSMALAKYINDIEKENKFLKKALISYLREASGKTNQLSML